MSDGAPITALVVVGADVDLDESAGRIRALAESFDRTCVFPSVLVGSGARHNVLDALRLAGVPVMEQRPLPAAKGLLGRVRSLFELAHWLRASDAVVVYAWSSDPRLLGLVRYARRLAPRVDELIEVSFARATGVSDLEENERPAGFRLRSGRSPS